MHVSMVYWATIAIRTLRQKTNVLYQYTSYVLIWLERDP